MTNLSARGTNHFEVGSHGDKCRREILGEMGLERTRKVFRDILRELMLRMISIAESNYNDD